MDRKQIEAAFAPPFEIIGPQRPGSPLIFNSPHSGRIYPGDFQERSRLTKKALRRSEDAFVDELFLPSTSSTPMLRARFPRAFLDVNREPYELDPALIADTLPENANTKSQSVTFGLGTVPRIVAEGVDIYEGKLSLAEAEDRLDCLYHPYHKELQNLIALTKNLFGYAVLIDCHSMPSARSLSGSANRPDFIIGDMNGKSCHRHLSDTAEKYLSSKGFAVTRNNPYAGGYITRNYGQPADNVHAVQIEINRALYMDERDIMKHKGFARLSETLRDFTAELTEAAWQIGNEGRIAAE